MKVNVNIRVRITQLRVIYTTDFLFDKAKVLF